MKGSLKLVAACVAAIVVMASACKGGGGGEQGEAVGAAVNYDVTIAVTSDSGMLGALQFDVDYVGSSGSWVTKDGAVACKAAEDVALSSFNDRGKGRVSAAMVDLEGFSTPGAVATCSLACSKPPTAADFRVTAVDASNPSLEPAAPFPAMAVTTIAEASAEPAASSSGEANGPKGDDAGGN